MATKRLRKTVGGFPIYATIAEYDSEGNSLSAKEDSANKVTSMGTTSTATDDHYPSELAVATALADKQDILVFDGTYDASNNPAATVSTVTEAISVLSGCEVSYDSSTGELHLDFSGGNNT